MSKKNVKNFIYKIHGILWGDELIKSLICIFILTVHEIVERPSVCSQGVHTKQEIKNTLSTDMQHTNYCSN